MPGREQRKSAALPFLSYFSLSYLVDLVVRLAALAEVGELEEGAAPAGEGLKERGKRVRRGEREVERERAHPTSLRTCVSFGFFSQSRSACSRACSKNMSLACWVGVERVCVGKERRRFLPHRPRRRQRSCVAAVRARDAPADSRTHAAGKPGASQGPLGWGGAEAGVHGRGRARRRGLLLRADAQQRTRRALALLPPHDRADEGPTPTHPHAGLPRATRDGAGRGACMCAGARTREVRFPQPAPACLSSSSIRTAQSPRG